MVLSQLRLLRILLAIVVPIVLTGALALASTTDQHRYNTRISPCYYHYTYQVDEPVDLLVLGGSSMMAAIDPQLLSKALGSVGHPNSVVLNMASPWYGADQMAQQFDEITRERAVSNALVMIRFEGVEPFHRKGYVTWPVADVLRGVTVPGEPVIERLSTVWHSVLKRLRDTVFVKHNALANYQRNPDKHLSLYADDNTCLRKELKDAQRSERLDMASQRVMDNGIKQAPYDWQTGNDYTLHYLKRLNTLATQRGVNVMMLRMPDMWEDAWVSDTLTSLSKYLGTRVLDIPLDLRWQLFDAQGYRDDRHLVTAGRELFTPWLATQLAPYLRP